MKRTFLLLLMIGAAAQQPGTPVSIGPAYTSHFPAVDVVLEPTGPTTTAPRPDELTLVGDGTQGNRARIIRPFRHTGEGLSVVLALDVSGSMRGRPLQAVREGLSGFVSKARTMDRIALVTIADEAQWETTWTTPPDELKQKLESIGPRGSLTRLWDSLDEALTRLEADDLPRRKRMVVISDGNDEGSRATLAQVIAHAHRLQVPVDAIGITHAAPVHLRNLERLSAETHGQFRAATDADSLQSNIGTGIERLLDSPVATFDVKLRGDGLEHQLAVMWSGNPSSEPLSVVLPKQSLPAGFEWWNGAAIGALLLGVTVLVLATRRRKTGALPAPLPLAPPAARVPAYVTPAPPLNPAPRAPIESIAVPAQRRKTEFGAAFPAPTAAAPAAWLQAVEGSAAGLRVPIDRVEFWIGAEVNNHCRIDTDDAVSGNHACIRFEGSTLRIYDNQSTNNTFVNLRPVGDTAKLLAPGDRIRIGRSTFVLEA